ncbi:hypothetical protein EI427_01065 [Flammeovirga pectinis]|uniref:Copper chaperone NosL n=2 Tax=Flammeovirga pectinis TaxID=2494373 RepID=A0A3Q9FNY5_9BACT|nr:hypothetical protein EI427_01065 [Flammeovirga pectinis]
MLIGSLLLIGVFLFPIWNIALEAPQYPVPLGMNIYLTEFKGANDEFDIKNINLMNHYVGMKQIPDTIPEFEYFPYVLGGVIILGLLFSFLGKPKLYLFWFVLLSVLGVLAMYDFYLWEHDYGFDLDPKAILSFKNDDGSLMGFQPPLIGSKVILNFVAHSYPRAGSAFLFVGMMLSVIAFWVGNKEAKTR